jgi:hypothetical protein
MFEEPVAMMRVAVILLSLSTLLSGCAPGRMGGRATDAARAAATPTSPPAPPPSPAPSPSPAVQAARIDFETQVRPLLQEKCSPCHFTGGRMYDRLPFDREETIRTLGEALFSRIRDPVDQELLRAFLEQPKDRPGASSDP